MKIAFISLSNHYTYQEIIYNLQKHISLNRKEIYVHTFSSEIRVYKSTNSKMENSYSKIPIKSRELIKLKYVKQFFTLKRKIREYNPDVIIIFNAHPWNLLITRYFKNKCRVINVLHDVIPHSGDKNVRKVEIYNKVIAKTSKEIIVHSDFSKQAFKKYKSNAIVHLTDLWREFREIQEPVTTNTVLFFGRVNHYKGIDNLMKIAKNLPNVKFLVVGKFDSDCISYIDELSLMNNVSVLNKNVDEIEMSEYFTSCELVIIPYNSASQSGVVIDAYSHSRPVIVFDVGGLSEQVKDGYSGFVVKNRDIVEFSNLVNYYINLSWKDKCMWSNNAWEFGFNKYSTQIGYERILEIIESKGE
jgi:glycosyltransferase involved in cell wall biosynthesis